MSRRAAARGVSASGADLRLGGISAIRHPLGCIARARALPEDSTRGGNLGQPAAGTDACNAEDDPSRARRRSAGDTTVTGPSLVVVPVLVDAPAAASMVGVSRRWWAELVRTGLAPAPIRLGRRSLWSRAALEQWAAVGCPARSGGERHEG